jgi:hypothetical protein
MNDPGEFDPIAASLRRQFSPPSLDALEQRIARAAAEHGHADTFDGAQPDPVAVPLEADRHPGWTVGFVSAFAVAAAIVLLLARPWERPEPSDVDAPVIAETAQPHELVPPMRAERAGFQLDAFLRRGDTLPTDTDDCKPPEPVEQCATQDGEPTLLGGHGVVVLGECGGSTGTDCGDFDLPADRALLVRYAPTGTQAIVCIERAWTDPHPRLPATSPYNIFRAELGEFVLYEITPLDQPQALDVFRL